MRTVQTSKAHTRLNITTKFSGRDSPAPGNETPFLYDAGSDLSSPPTSASPPYSSSASSSSSSNRSDVIQHTTHRARSRAHPRIQLSALLAAPSLDRSYQLQVVQNPQQTAEFGNSNPLSRLPLTPPIIVQLTVRDASGNIMLPEEELPFLVAHLSLFAENGTVPLDMGSTLPTNTTQPILYGSLVSTVEHLEDPNGNMGLFFIFTDVSVRWRGRFQLGITLIRILSHNGPGLQRTSLAQTKTNNFNVVPYNEYTALPQTRLTQIFLRQRMNSLDAISR